ncbi:MAG: acetyl-CoA carboxylase biotin carboxylase subunit, partial [Kiloniellales bacterium]
ADESVCIGPPPARDSYLNVAAILTAATVTNAEAIHPGVGFLSENADFAQMVEEHGFTFIGPKTEHIRLMGDKMAARQAAQSLGLPVIPGSQEPVHSLEAAQAQGREIGFPVLLKAVSGGGGHGLQRVAGVDQLEQALALAREEARSGFGSEAVYLEKRLDAPRHIEVQVLGDHHGNVVHFGERDCSVQRRHQKVIEEAPSPALNAAERDWLGRNTVEAMRELGYRNAGTVEFLYENGTFYFLEMNTRLQVEHPVTEMISDVDLVREQIRIAAGAPLGYGQDDIVLSGHAIECRLAAEHPESFLPSPGRVTEYHPPGGLGVRFESALYTGYTVPAHYDSLVAKLVVHGKTRNECLMRLRRALGECVIGGIDTTIPLHLKLIAEIAFIDGDYDVNWLELVMRGEAPVD